MKGDHEFKLRSRTEVTKAKGGQEEMAVSMKAEMTPRSRKKSQRQETQKTNLLTPTQSRLSCFSRTK